MSDTATPRPDGLLRVAAVLDAASPDPERDARALAGFLRDGLSVAAGQGVTFVLCTSEADQERLVALAPTADVRPVRAPAHRRIWEPPP